MGNDLIFPPITESTFTGYGADLAKPHAVYVYPGAIHSNPSPGYSAATTGKMMGNYLHDPCRVSNRYRGESTAFEKTTVFSSSAGEIATIFFVSPWKISVQSGDVLSASSPERRARRIESWVACRIDRTKLARLSDSLKLSPSDGYGLILLVSIIRTPRRAIRRCR